MPRPKSTTAVTTDAPAKPALPKGWQWVRFGDVVRQVQTKADPQTSGVERYVAGEHMDTDDLRIRRWGTIGDHYLGPAFHRRFEAGQILYGSRRTYLRKVAVAEWPGICANTTFVIEARKGTVIVPEILPWIMSSEAFHDYSIRNSKGSVNPYINFSDLVDYEFALPSDPAEQRRIADLLRAADDAVEAWREVAGRTNVLRNSLIAGMSSRKRAESASGKMRPGWTYEPLGNRYTIQLGKMMSPEAVNGESKRPYMRNANVQWNRLDLSDVAEMHFDDDEVAKFELKPGDILACEGRHVGKSAIWRGEIPGACFQKALHRLRPKSSTDLPEYLLLCLWDCELTGRFKQLIGETTIPHLPAERFRELHMAFPPRDEQAEFVKLIGQVDADRSAAFDHANRERAILEQLSHLLLTPPETP